MTEEEKKARRKTLIRQYEEKPENKRKRNERARKRRHANKDAFNARQRELKNASYKNLKQNLAAKVNSARDRAKRLGREFDITVADIHVPEFCPILGTKLVPCGTNGNRENSLSLDRVDNNKGYVKGNVAVISAKANQMKNALTIDVTKRLLAYMECHALSA